MRFSAHSMDFTSVSNQQKELTPLTLSLDRFSIWIQKIFSQLIDSPNQLPQDQKELVHSEDPVKEDSGHNREEDPEDLEDQEHLAAEEEEPPEAVEHLSKEDDE